MRRFAQQIAASGNLVRHRLNVILAASLLCAAAGFVRVGRLSLVERSLGIVREGGAIIPPEPAASSALLAAARRTGRHVERAALRLPFATKCLPRAMAAQWLLRLRGMPASLVFAVHVRDRCGDHAYHAWVECDGEFIIGHCERDDYRPVMIIDYTQRTDRRVAVL